MHIDFHGFRIQLSLTLPHDTTPLIALLLPDNIFELSISPPSNGALDSAVIPACIHSLPNLEYLDVFINVSTHTFQPFNNCTTAKYSFRSRPISKKIMRAHLVPTIRSGISTFGIYQDVRVISNTSLVPTWLSWRRRLKSGFNK